MSDSLLKDEDSHTDAENWISQYHIHNEFVSNYMPKQIQETYDFRVASHMSDRHSKQNMFRYFQLPLLSQSSIPPKDYAKNLLVLGFSIELLFRDSSIF